MGTYQRFVALGDSTTEGIGDTPYADGSPRGWADRFAALLAERSPTAAYANLAVRGKVTREVRDEQLAPALALEPDLVSLVVAMNDLLRPRFSAPQIVGDVDTMVGALRRQGASVLLMTFPDLTAVSPVGRALRGRVVALNRGFRSVAARHGATLLDMAPVPAAGDPRVWADDRLHLNPDGHALLARAMASAAGLEGADLSWTAPLPPPAERTVRERLGTEVTWYGTHVGPWLGRRFTGRSSGDGRTAKRPDLGPAADTR
ncbi:SGNH/GDSL hydrolase family protein [Mumia zhuanghuii]|uniref:SGNH/GDSL hydrolase family protein n=1 Tax=Mumia zhuanghuii TaxID=2585211 RepID=A0A5C4N2V1_9ACTN|nr:SGNH/GDSL hydrolase family protein [Mumia zhuanghuii]TNC51334.1 SGNH/GDSL hydrolase family protein [Mumia zhuanghuii]TNC52194.1 SGNH/GDSL hydrolase family protein [Mumia zhuanghuii]